MQNIRFNPISGEENPSFSQTMHHHETTNEYDCADDDILRTAPVETRKKDRMLGSIPRHLNERNINPTSHDEREIIQESLRKKKQTALCSCEKATRDFTETQDFSLDGRNLLQRILRERARLQVKKQKLARKRNVSRLNFPDMFISTRFGPGVNQDSHTKAKQLYEELKKPIYEVKAYLVESYAGGNIGEMVVRSLAISKAMVVIGCRNYGAKTQSPYSTREELRYAYEQGLLIIAIQFCEDWPPTPDPDIDGIGFAQNRFILGNKGLHKLHWSKRKWDPAECAKEVSKAFHSYIDSINSTQEKPFVNNKNPIPLQPMTPIECKGDTCPSHHGESQSNRYLYHFVTETYSVTSFIKNVQHDSHIGEACDDLN